MDLNPIIAEPNNILARKIWMLAAKWQERNPTKNLYHQKAKLELTMQIADLLDGKSSAETKRVFDVFEAQELRICRICRGPSEAKPGNPFVLNYGDEHAHQKCLENETK